MGNLSNILNGPFTPPEPKPVVDQLRDAMLSNGITPPPSLHIDGNIHRFSTSDTGRDDAGWYIVYPDGVPAGRFGDWRTGHELTFRADVGRPYSMQEEMQYKQRIAESIARRNEEKERKHKVAADTVSSIWSNGTTASPDHPYLKRKGIGVNGARVTGDGRLMVPLFDQSNNISSIQYISADGQKMYHAGGAVKGCHWVLGDIEASSTIFVAEGFATAATIYEETGQATVVAYSAGNIVSVTESIRKSQETKPITIVADNDKSGVGKSHADQAAAKFGASVVVPPIEGDVNDYRQSGGNVSDLVDPPKRQWLISADEFASQPAPISWIVKHWIQDKALVMVHGKSGSGKTFAVLDWCMRISSGVTDWFGNKVRPGTVVYLAGEGHHGMRARVAAWRAHHRVTKTDMYISQSACNINSPIDLQETIQHIKSCSERPAAIVIDTLHRFFDGDENSAKDTKTMLDACSVIMREFDCTVIIVHHTGVSDEAQHRARGSSAWRGALDIEISVKPTKKGFELRQVKTKDSEEAQPMAFSLVSHNIPGWFDEDNEPVHSAIIDEIEMAPETDTTSKDRDLMKDFESAWFFSGAETTPEGNPFVNKSVMKNWLEQNKGKTERTAGKAVYDQDKFYFKALFESGMLENNDGSPRKIVCIDGSWSSQLGFKAKGI